MPENDTIKSEAKDVITDAITFLQKIRANKQVRLKFLKKDGTDRVMLCTLDFKKIPANRRPKTVNLEKILKLVYKNGILHVFDLEKKEWRSVPFDKVEWMEDEEKKLFRIVPKK